MCLFSPAFGILDLGGFRLGEKGAGKKVRQDDGCMSVTDWVVIGYAYVLRNGLARLRHVPACGCVLQRMYGVPICFVHRGVADTFYSTSTFSNH